MILLRDILYRVNLTEVVGSTNMEISGVQFDSRKIGKGDLFIATKGTQSDGHNYIDKAIELGAIAIVCEEMPVEKVDRLTYIKVKNSARTIGIVADNFYDHPSSKLRLIGITGTNGKTSTATMLFNLFRKLGLSCGLISTIQNQIDDEVIPTTHTTPDAIKLNELLIDMIDKGCEYCFMEVSSHAVVQERIAGLKFSGAIFTNISHDHLDYHGTFKDYIQAKKKFFDELTMDAFALVNADDRNGSVMLQNTKASKFRFSLKTPSEFKGKIMENTFAGLVMQIDQEELYSRLIGEFNAYNLLAVYGTTQLLGIDKIEALKVLSNLKSAEGRFDYIVSEKSKVIGIVDYAHTPDALKKVLETIQKIRTGQEHVISIIGCGGDRDVEKRPVMARVACEFSDKVILTSDNPRSEEPKAIISDMERGVEIHHKKKVLSIVDRKEAIKTACSLAHGSDIILLAGKGHEKYQDIKGEKFPFDDRDVLTKVFKELEK